VVAETPWSFHGETTVKPMPTPNASKIKVTAAAAMPPPITAPQHTVDDSSSTTTPVTGIDIFASS